MSMILTLTSAAILAGVTLTGTSLSVIASKVSDGIVDEIPEGLDTMFVDCQVLIDTLNGFDCHINQVDENTIYVETTAGNLRYARQNNTEAFKLYLDEVRNADALYQNIKQLEVDYGRNVQSYTYDHIKQNLSKGMTIQSEEVLEDDTLFLTINVE
ncbi:MAG: hypothetical protein IJL63_06165 [Clostridia bacterium]|nr:hypothetical protein [Clostridia bacterium]